MAVRTADLAHLMTDLKTSMCILNENRQSYEILYWRGTRVYVTP